MHYQPIYVSNLVLPCNDFIYDLSVYIIIDNRLLIALYLITYFVLWQPFDG